MFGSLTRAAVFSFSLGLAALGTGQSYTKLDRDLRGVSAADAVERLDAAIGEDSDLRARIDELRDAPEGLDEVKEIVARRAAAESLTSGDENWTVKAGRIKKANPLFRDVDEKESSNWLAKAYRRLIEAIQEWLKRLRAPNVSTPTGLAIGPWLVYLFWGLLGSLLILFLYLVVRHFSWKGKLRRKASALLDEDEPERSLDEWLALADKLEAEGRFREAVRCLYLACLLKFDEYHVARFDRGQTNWEHLARISQSRKLPDTLDFSTPTRAFDRVWYGKIVEGRADVERFRAWYAHVVGALAGVAA